MLPVRPMSSYELARIRVRDQVAQSRPRSHRITQDLSTPSLLRDIGPGLWISINPGYTHANRSFFTSSHHAKQDAFMAHADKCLQLGEKPFLSGGMKLTG